MSGYRSGEKTRIHTVRVGFSKRKPVESAVARAFSTLGHEVIFKRSKADFESFVRNNNLDILFLSSSAPVPSPKIVQKLQNNCRVIYWERRAPPKGIDNNRYRFRNYFTIYNDGSGRYLPCAAEDHLFLKEDERYGVSLVAKDVFKKPRKRQHEKRVRLQKMIFKDASNRFTMYGDIPEKRYDDRFEIMANSVCSIGIWNADKAVPLRYFEIISTSTPLITYPYETFRSLFVPGEHYVETESLSLTLDALSGDKERFEAIGRAGYEHFLQYHTYKHRVKFMLSVLNV